MTVPAVLFDSVSKVYPSIPGRTAKPALDGVSLEIAPGDTVGLVGPNGAGKTTFVKILLGLVRPTSGAARAWGHEPGAPEIAGAIGYVPELPASYPFLSARETLELFRYGDPGIPGSRCSELLGLVGLERDADRPVAHYSKGMKVRLGIAVSLLASPRLLVLDEPTTGLDPVALRSLVRVLEALRAEGRTILLSSHDLRTVSALCARVVLIDRGRIVCDRAAAEWTAGGRTLEDAVVERLEAAPDAGAAGATS